MQNEISDQTKPIENLKHIYKRLKLVLKICKIFFFFFNLLIILIK